jgi:hypothetical protein
MAGVGLPISTAGPLLRVAVLFVMMDISFCRDGAIIQILTVKLFLLASAVFANLIIHFCKDGA